MKRTVDAVGNTGRATLAVLAAMLLAALGLAGPAWAVVRSDATPVFVPEFGPASPYPSTVYVSGLSGVVTDVNVTLKDVNHTFPEDLNVLLVGPGGQNVTLVGSAGNFYPLQNVFLTLDDAATGPLPRSSAVTSGTYEPTDHDPDNSLPAPAPQGPYGSSLDAFNGTDPNGRWRLFVSDAASGDKGRIAGGYSLNIKTDTAPANDAFAATVPLFGNTTAVSSNNVAATLEAGEGVPLQGAENSVWFSWTAQKPGRTTVDTCSSDFDTMLGLYTGSALETLARQDYDDDGCSAPNRLGSKLIFNTPAGQEYRIQVLGASDDEEGTFSLKVAGNTPPKVAITSPPSTTTVRRPPVNATVRDAQSVLPAANIEVFLDGVRRTGFVYDPADGALSYTPGSRLSYGKHTARIEATDPHGLKTAKSRSFTVARPG